ncbi:MAG: hypothetical protein PUD63_12285 [Clostridia bacterium]|nr:hypothetical protein [Clostridia bacterium]
MEKMTVYISPDGEITIRWPRGSIPDRATIEELSRMIEKTEAARQHC